MRVFAFVWMVLSFVFSFSNTSMAAEPTTASHVSLREKIAQMLVIGFDGKQLMQDSDVVHAINQDGLGGVILFDYNQQTHTFDKNIESPQQLSNLTHALQDLNNQANEQHHRPRLPLIISVDYEGGQVNRLGEQYGFPHTISAETVGQMPLDAVLPVAHEMASTLVDMGFNVNFAPVLDVNVNPSNPIVAKKERSFSSDPKRVVDDARIYTQQFLDSHIQCAYKHFPGHGSSKDDSHLGFVDVTSSWRSYELEPYQILLGEERHCGMVMVAHVVNKQLDTSGLPASLSYAMVTHILRDELQFNGVVITDDLQMKAISQQYGVDEALVLAINAGVDMLIFGNQLDSVAQDPKKLIDQIAAKVESGEISVDRIDEAYQRIIRFKQSIAS